MILKVPRLGEKTFEQAAGFLRINDGDNPLDRSAVHPEAYPVVERMLARLNKGIAEVMGQAGCAEGTRAGGIYRRDLRSADGARHPHGAGKTRP
jgi:uncharacterized protein